MMLVNHKFNINVFLRARRNLRQGERINNDDLMLSPVN